MGGVFTLGVVVGKRLTGAPIDHAQPDLLAQLDRKATAIEPKRMDDALTFQNELTKAKPMDVRPVAAVAPNDAEATGLHQPTEVAPKEEEQPSLALAGNRLPTKPESHKETPKAPAAADSGMIAARVREIPRAPAPIVSAGKAAQSFSLQIASSRSTSDAERVRSRLLAKGFDAYIIPVELPQTGTWYRVRVGHFPTRESATRALLDLKQRASVAAIVTSQ